MQISVVIPTWNRAAQVAKAVESVKQQSMTAAEIIVVDDGSTDGTIERLGDLHPDIHSIRQANAGVSSARNTGIRAATGDWIALLDSDDEWFPAKLECQSQFIHDNPDYRLIHSDEIWIRNGVKVNPKHKHRKYGGWIYPHCLPLCAISPSAVMLRKDVFSTVGYFDETLPACEDYDFWLRVCAHEPVGYLDQPLVKKYGGHADQLSQRHWGMDRFRMQALAKAIESGTLDPTDLQLTREQLARKLEIFCLGAKKRNNLAFAAKLQQQYHPLLNED